MAANISESHADSPRCPNPLCTASLLSMHTTEAQGSECLRCGFSRLSLMIPELDVQDLFEEVPTSKPRVGIERGSIRGGKAATVGPEGSRVRRPQFGIRLRFPRFPKRPVLQITSAIRAKRERIRVPVENIEAAVPDVRPTSIWDIFKRYNVVKKGPKSTKGATDPTRTDNLDHRSLAVALSFQMKTSINAASHIRVHPPKETLT